jgi:hypothetical protein
VCQRERSAATTTSRLLVLGWGWLPSLSCGCVVCHLQLQEAVLVVVVIFSAMDLILRHQSMASICESEVGARLFRLSLSLSPAYDWFAHALCSLRSFLVALQDALGSSESEPARPARPRGKRSRAAEVHNLSEKVGACVPGVAGSLTRLFPSCSTSTTTRRGRLSTDLLASLPPIDDD